MGQSQSASSSSSSSSCERPRRSKSRSAASSIRAHRSSSAGDSIVAQEDDEKLHQQEIQLGDDDCTEGERDYISDLPDECLACVFQCLSSGDRNRCALVSRRWLVVEGQSRQRLSLDARADLGRALPSILSRFDSVSRLVLKCERRSISIGDDALLLVARLCPNLARLKLRACRELTDAGLAAFAAHAPNLRKLSCGSCTFGAGGLNAVLDRCAALEEISVKRLRSLNAADAAGLATVGGPGAAAAASLRTVCLKDLYNGQCFVPLILAAKNLATLKLLSCSGDWDELLEALPGRHSSTLAEIHLERVQVSDRGLAAIASCSNLEILHLVKSPECTNAGLISIAEGCKLLRKLHIDGWKTNRIGDEGLMAVARRCPKLQELVLIGVNPTTVSLGLLAGNCRRLERLALCRSETFGDAEMSCIAAKCAALKKLCIKGCPVSDQGLEALACGCPSLVKVKVKKCRGVTPEGADLLRTSRGSVVVNIDITPTTAGAIAASTIDPQDGILSDGGETAAEPVADYDLQSNSSGRSVLSKARLGLFAGRNFMACTFRRWSSRRHPAAY